MSRLGETARFWYTVSTLGLHREVALVGFDDLDLAAAVQPGITVMPQQPTELGRLAGRMLLDRLDGYSGGRRRALVDSELIERGSGEIAPLP